MKTFVPLNDEQEALVKGLEVDLELLKVRCNGLEAALQISRDSERQTKERLTSVSEQLTDAKAEIWRLNDQLTDLLVEKEKNGPLE